MKIMEAISKRELARKAKNRERLLNRITHHYNELSPDEEGVHCCIVLGEFLEKNPDIQLNLSKHLGLREALGSQEVRTLVKIGNVFVGTPGYNWDLGTTRSTPHPLSIVPINSEFHNAELAHIAIKSHRRCAYDLQRARGKRSRHRLVESHDGHQLRLQFKCPITIIFPRLIPGRPNSSMNGILPFLNPYSSYTYTFYSTIESIIHQEVPISH